MIGEDCICVCVEMDEAAIEAAAILPGTLTSSILGYHHRSMKGDLESKRKVLYELGNVLEPDKNGSNR